MSEAIPLYTISRCIMDTDADIARRQKLSSMFGMFQDIAALHAENLGAAVDWLYRKLNLAWILMRVRVEIDQYPVLSQEVVIETWPQEPRALYERDYLIRDMAGKVLVRAASTWVIMNLGTREIKRDRFLDYFGLELIKDRALEKSIVRLRTMDRTKPVYAKEVKFSDVDYNVHVNNAKYVDFIMDCFSIEEHRERAIKAIEVHFINEIGPGETLKFRRKKVNERKDYVEGLRKTDGAYVFNALVEWN